MSGPWRIDGRSSVLHLFYPGNEPRRYEVEYRRAEPGAPAGYYLFGHEFDGLPLVAGTADDARFEAFARIAQRCALPDFFAAVEGGRR